MSVNEEVSTKEVTEQEVEEVRKKGIILSTLDRLLNTARSRSFWPLTFGMACCAIEMMATGGARYDLGRFGYEVFRPSPRQADVMIIAGTITKKVEPIVKRLYDQMAEPKWVIAMGNCAISGGPYQDSYNVVRGLSEFIPVDIYIPGCPPKPEALIDGLLKLKNHVEKGNYARK
ncbi:MAG: NADH dehydrogenase [Gracilibacter sp. BRH_c7a]|nr:MAG: NADH dehydrogenase [Gracilibacter sp. BRH_c7a]